MFIGNKGFDAYHVFSPWGSKDSPDYSNWLNNRGEDEWIQQGAWVQEGAGRGMHQSY